MMKETDRGVLAWKHVSLTFNPRWQRPGQRPAVLDDVCGFAQVGELSLTLGSSGSGKTSLLLALAGALTSNKFGLSGELSLHGSIARCGRKKQVGVALITQQDMLFSHLTVRETLDLAALFFMDNSTHAQRTIRVKAVLRELGLTSVQNVMVGSDTKRGVSGGERKRVAIAREMISAPKIVLADEVTSGLDSFNAANVIESLHSLAQAGRIVICAIHQPRSAIFNMFDRVTVLSQGRLMFFGERRVLSSYLAAAGFPCPATFNMADHIVDVVTLDERTPESQSSSQARIDLLANTVSKDQILTDIESFARLDEEGEGDGDDESFGGGSGSPDLEESKDEHGSSPKPSFFSRISGEDTKTSTTSSGQGGDCGSVVRHYLLLVVVLFLRAGLKNIRLWKEWLIQLTVLLMLAAIVALLFYQTDRPGASLVQDRLGLLFFVVINQSFGPCLDTARTFQSEKGVVKAEIARGGYLMSAYFISRFLSTLPFALINATLYSTVVYFSVGFKLDAGSYFIFLGIVSILTVTSQSFGLLLSSLTSSETVATSLATPFLIIFVLAGGFYLNAQSFPKGAGWLVYTSLCYYGFTGLAINELSGATFACTGSYKTSTSSAQCQTTGEQVLSSLGFGDNSILEAFVGLFLLTILFLGLSFSAMVILKERSLVMQKPSAQQQQQQQEEIVV